MQARTGDSKWPGIESDRLRQPPEDYELWSRIARRFRVANLPERLTVYREVAASMSREGTDPFKEKLILISAENLAAASTGVPKPEAIHFDIASLFHDSPEKLSKTADIDAMCAVITEAGHAIFGRRNSIGDDQAASVAFRIRNLRHRFAIRKHGLSQVRNAARRLKRTLQRFGVPI